MASALYDPLSPVPIRVFARGRTAFDGAWVERQLDRALTWRKQIVPDDTSGYRLIHSEGDGMPGLIADRYGDHLSLRYSQALWGRYEAELLSQIRGVCPSESFSFKNALLDPTVLAKPAERVSYLVNGLVLFAAKDGGQKTGAFLDQRENYLAAIAWVKRLGLSGFGLDLYTANGGFALHLAATLRSVEAVDSSETALAYLREAASRAQYPHIRAIHADVREYLQGKANARQSYDAIVVDPPAFAKNKRSTEEALTQYLDINSRALRLLKPNGLFVTCSCSHHISGEDLLEIIRQAALKAGKSLQLLEQRKQSLDHPILIGIPESEYLKCFIFRASESLS